MDSVLFGRTLDAPLDARGERQARALAERLGAHLDRDGASPAAPALEASPRLRTRQTAAALASRLHCELRTAPEVDEIDFGCWSGQAFSALAEDPGWRRWNEQRAQARTPAGETIAGVQRRVVPHLLAFERRGPAGTIAIVTHAEIIRTVLLYCLGAPFDAYRRIEISPASLTTLRLRGGELSIEAVNECATA